MYLNWKKILKVGYDRNIVVFDIDAKKGQLTKRLLNLVQEISWDYDNNRVTDIFVSESVNVLIASL